MNKKLPSSVEGSFFFEERALAMQQYDRSAATLRDWVGLSMASGLGPSGFWQLIKAAGSPTAVLDMMFCDIKRIPGMRDGQLNGLKDAGKLREAAQRELEMLNNGHGQAVIPEHPYYPELLKKCVNPPPVLYVKGNGACLNSPTVAVVGSRAATAYGRRTAYNLGRDLAGSGIAVVSGLATGIDAEAHSGCLNGRGETIGVLGCGLDVVYPRTNKSLYRQVAERGALVTEYNLGTKPEGFRFPARNRIIAGMSHGVVVVEAARRSGSLITVGHALDEGREVFAVPGQVDSVKSSGTHWLLQQGAVLAVSAADIVDSLGIGKRRSAVQGAQQETAVELDSETAALLAIIEAYPMQRNELIERSGMTAAKISEHLLLLELEGMIEILPGDQVRRTAK